MRVLKIAPLSVVPKKMTPIEFAVSCNSKPAPRCECCANKEARDAIQIIAAERRAGRSEATAQGLWEYLRDTYGVRGSVSAVRRHLREHTKWYTPLRPEPGS